MFSKENDDICVLLQTISDLEKRIIVLFSTVNISMSLTLINLN